MRFVKNLVKDYLKKLGFDVVKYSQAEELNNNDVTQKEFPPDFDKEEIDIIREASPYTMTSPERIYALIQSVRYISKNNIDGDIVECGVWKGGSMMAAALTLSQIKDNNRHLYLFDTFEGMTEPTEKDLDYKGHSASTLLENSVKSDESSVWCYATLETVEETLQKTGYDREKLHFIKGKVEQTIPDKAPQNISILRLDTDWYESTRHELIHLFPRLSTGGVIIIDDYGFWKGSRLASDEYISQNNIKILFNRIDQAGRIGIKL